MDRWLDECMDGRTEYRKGHQEASTQSRQDTTTPVMAVVQTAITEFSYFAK